MFLNMRNILQNPPIEQMKQTTKISIENLFYADLFVIYA